MQDVVIKIYTIHHHVANATIHGDLKQMLYDQIFQYKSITRHIFDNTDEIIK